MECDGLWVANRLDPGQVPSNSAPGLDLTCLHKICFPHRKGWENIDQLITSSTSATMDSIQCSFYIWLDNENYLKPEPQHQAKKNTCLSIIKHWRARSVNSNSYPLNFKGYAVYHDSYLGLVILPAFRMRYTSFAKTCTSVELFVYKVCFYAPK